MSFSSKVKEELLEINVETRHCKIAELTALLVFSGKVSISENDEYWISLQTENRFVTKRFDYLLRDIINGRPEVSVRKNMKNKNLQYLLLVKGETAKELLLVSKLLDKSGDIRGDMSLVSKLIIQKSCCKRAFIRGAFLSAGSISDPEKGYHFEIVANSEQKAASLKEILGSFGLNSKIVKRKKYYPVYVKEGEELSELLGLMEAQKAILSYEQVRVVKDVRNRVNRNVNLETANLNKTVKAANKIISDIEYIRDFMGLYKLPKALEELAELRLSHPEASLSELSGLLSNTVGKSGVNHRLQKMSRIADELRMKREEW